MYEIPKDFKLKYDESLIDDAISKIADNMNKFFMTQDFKDKKILILAVLNGALYFTADLTRKLKFNAEVASIKASSYTNNKQGDSVQIQGYGFNVKDKVIILIDDICDTGHTLKMLSKTMKELGAKEVYSVSLLQKKANTCFVPTFSGIVYDGDDWFVGFGMDDSEYYRHLPKIYTKEKVY